MRITAFEVTNYKSYRSAGPTPLGERFNVVVGRNDVGKTALVEALSTRFQNRPHRSKRTAPFRVSTLDPTSTAQVTVTLDTAELTEILAGQRFQLTLVIPSQHTSHADQTAVMLLRQMRETGWVSFRFSIESRNTNPAEVVSAELIGWGGLIHNYQSVLQVSLATDQTMTKSDIEQVYSSTPTGSLAFVLANHVIQRIYLFRAERLNVGVSSLGFAPVLLSDASNLPNVISHLQENPARLARLNTLVRRIFPELHSVTVQTTDRSQLQIMVWAEDPSYLRDDLAFPLNEGGTGVGQVLAILSVLLTSDHPRVILIDEPQSFLHPGAIRNLFEVLWSESSHDHQYVVTTHSPTVITAAMPAQVLLVRKVSAESNIEVITMEEGEQQRQFLLEVGARLSDVFGADNILWVEGATEERCYPKILRQLSDVPLMGTVVLGVRNTGELEGKQAAGVFEIYKRLSTGPGLLPPAVGFVFDRENRTATQMVDLQRQSGNQVSFIPRHMYENYLVNPDAIAAVMASVDQFSEDGTAVAAATITAWLDEHKWKAKYISRVPPKKEQSLDRWRSDVHGAKVLNDIFGHFSSNRYPYDKVVYGEQLTDWIIVNASDELRELADVLAGVLEDGRASNADQ